MTRNDLIHKCHSVATAHGTGMFYGFFYLY